MEKTKRVALYARVSTSDQTSDNQLLELRRHCASRGWSVVREFVDHAVSGSKKDRPHLRELMEFAWAGDVDCVLVWRFDRFARSLSHLVEALEEFRERGIDFASHQERIDTGTSQGKLMFGIFASFAEFERNIIQERIHAGLARARAQGTRLGRAPLSSRKVADILTLRGKASIRAIATRIGVSKSVVHKVLSTRPISNVASPLDGTPVAF
jgi:DNA invertase Pin-like site-specific DNA recombinase